MASQFNSMPTYQTPLLSGMNLLRDWYFFFAGLFRGLPPANVEPVTVGSSPYVYSAVRRGVMIVDGGTVTLVEFSRDGTNWFDSGTVAGMFHLSAADRLRVTHAGAPTMTFAPT
jgi:hypothetical protein